MEVSAVIKVNHFPSDFLHLDKEESCVEIAVKFSFQDRELVFDDVSAR